ncbi:MAG: polysaccharide deacetylase family protein [Gammaproteobacteria bacterium]|nr:polysaccharide deacetylase family protein [Gammaproteobacteria bacterium]
MKKIIKQAVLLGTNVTPPKALFGNKVRIIMYHGVDDTGLTASHFRQQMVFVKKHFSTYWASEAKALLSGEIVPDKPPIVLTFDDGLRNNATVAAPILDELGLKATFYLVSDLLDGQSMLWNHELRGRLMLMDRDRYTMVTQEVLPHAESPSERQVVESIKTWNHTKRTEFLTRLREEEPNPAFTEDMLKAWLIMDTEDAKKLPACIEIGSHTKTHPILDTLDLREAEDEIVSSRYILEEQINKPVPTFCYPNGNYTKEMLSSVQEHYDMAVSVNEGFGNRNELHELKRIPAANNMRDFVFRLLRPAA